MKITIKPNNRRNKAAMYRIDTVESSRPFGFAEIENIDWADMTAFQAIQVMRDPEIARRDVAMEDMSTVRTHGDTEEHRHEDFDYWHPVERPHNAI